MSIFADLFGGQGQFNIAGGFNLSQQELEATRLALQNRLAQKEFGRSLLQQLFDVQRDPFSIVPAITAFGQGPGAGGVLAPAVDFAASGGKGRPAPPIFGDLASQILKQLGSFATGAGGSTGTPTKAKNSGQTPFNITNPASVAAILKMLEG